MKSDRSVSIEEFERLRRQLDRERAIRQQAEEIAEAATRRLYDTDRMKTLFVTTVSHELRTPLTPVVGFAEGLCAKWDRLSDDQRREMVSLIYQNAENLRSLIDSLLDFRRLEESEFALDLQTVDLAANVLTHVQALETLAREHEFETALQEGVLVRADHTALGRIVTNLMGNAVKYTPKGGQIRVSTAAAEGFGLLIVEDSGQGIAPEERERIFERFYRSEREALRRQRGLGIGLALVRALADAMDGSAAVDESSLGGARFTVRFPSLGV